MEIVVNLNTFVLAHVTRKRVTRWDALINCLDLGRPNRCNTLRPSRGTGSLTGTPEAGAAQRDKPISHDFLRLFLIVEDSVRGGLEGIIQLSNVISREKALSIELFF